MPRLTFKVVVPAMMPTHTGITPDPMPRYDGGVSLPSGGIPVNFGQAIVTGGTKVGKKWMGCTYIKPPFTIPGFGEIEEAGM